MDMWDNLTTNPMDLGVDERAAKIMMATDFAMMDADLGLGNFKDLLDEHLAEMRL